MIFEANELIMVYGICKGGSSAVSSWLLGQHRDLEGYDISQEEVPGYHLTDKFVQIKTIPNIYISYPDHPDIFDKSKYEKGHIFERMVFCYEQGDYFTQENIDFVHTFVKPKITKNVVTIRDGRNWLASSIKSNHYGTHLIRSWKQLAEEYLGITNHLDDKVCILFDKWFADVDYRKDICNQLDIDFTDINYGKMHSDSAFEGKFTDGAMRDKAQELGVLERYKEFSTDQKYGQSYNQIWELNEKILEIS